ncbi:MAG: glutamate synthase large subunit [Gammaproteobacteria bacterium]|nr:MAG: glutamate synthase large subunit [Gammaproteobacteria bacterium]
MSQNRTHFTGAKGLYNPEHEHDACGVGFIADIKNRKSHKIVRDGLEILLNLTHRGAVGADPREGDGAGILIQLPDQFFRRVCSSEGMTLPEEGSYGVGMLFLPQDKDHIQKCKDIIEAVVREEGQNLLGWRRVPTDRVKADLPESVINCEPVIEQVFIGSALGPEQQDNFERKLYVIRKQIEHRVSSLGFKDEAAFYIPSMSSRVIVYKGMFLSHQVGAYFEDLGQPDMVSALALVHQRFSTNTFPAWELSHPFRMIAHNGEINTVRGNVNWMRARRHSMASTILGDDLEKLWPLIEEGQSDSACFDNALELLVAGGYSLAHAAMLMIPEAWSGNPLMDPARKAFYEYYSALMEPWDGPAAMAFTDGRQIGATLDRNGLRPARYLLTKDDLVIMSSEAGVLPVDEKDIVRKWRLQPGKMFLIDLEEGRIIDDAEIKQKLASEHPYDDILKRTQIRVDDLPGGEDSPVGIEKEALSASQQAFGMTKEDIKFLMMPMAVAGQEAVGSMGSDTPLAVLSNHAKPLYNYFRQLFAQVTNPPIDPLREEMVMSLTSIIGPRPNLLDLDHSEPNMRLEVDQPILTDEAFEKIARIGEHGDIPFRSKTLSICYPAEEGKGGMQTALDRLCEDAQKAVESHTNILILSDMDAGQDRIAIPALLATSAVHHHLIRKGLRTETGLVIQTGSAREVHHFALLAGYGAEAIHPYLAYQTLADIKKQGYLPEEISVNEAIHRYIKAVDKGLLKVMSKMGISTYQSYCGAQIFEAIGLRHDFVEQYFTGTTSQIEGIGIEEVATEAVKWHQRAYRRDTAGQSLPDGGEYAWRVNGESHMWSPETISLMQHAVRSGDYGLFKQFSAKINDQGKALMTLRGLFEFSPKNRPVPLEEVESAEEIVKRFATGAMSYGSISHEAHTTLAIAMNRLGAKSNTGEGGEDPERFTADDNGDLARSAIKQVASGRFGVTTEYLVNADAIQIKIAQGAKPGEGGQLPGHKVNEVIARVRHSTQGVGLISPPPHHDIYSIEDIAQLIFDLKNVNPRAAISVKLVAEVGVGTVAAGVVKAHADHVTISGFDGGTGASPLTSIKHAGGPWELGLAETQQTLVLNRLRGRMRLQVDGQMRTGRDIVIGALLGADEFGFGTAALVAEGCIMMRKCHLNTCPVGVATQDPELRKRFTGKPEHVVNYFMFVAREVRELMAELGFRTFNEMIGRTDCLNVSQAIRHWKSENLDLSPILHRQVGVDTAVYHQEQQDHGLEKVIDNKLIEMAKPALDDQVPVQIEMETNNTQRSFGAMLSGEVARRYGHAGLQEDTIHIKVRGTAGQSFGAWLANGITLELQGDANDYVGKGLSGGHIIIYPAADSPLKPEENIIIGNTVLYGAISGECYFSGVAGERFAVRNSGAIAVVEGVGDHGCEYMTGGTVVVLGQSGRNFAAGMSGGIAYVLDETGDFEQRCNMAMVSLEPVESESDAIEKLDYQGADLETHGRVDVKHSLDLNDERLLWILVRRHLHYTNSQRARAILENWKQYREKFVKVMPVDYRRALHEMERMRQEAASMQSGEKANG